MNPKKLVVVGAGMVAQRLVEALVERDATATWTIEVLGEEPHRPYDRVALTSYFGMSAADELYLGSEDLWDTAGVTLRTDAQVTAIDHAARTAECAGEHIEYDALVIATGSRAFVPPVAGSDLPGSFVYRTIDDVVDIREWVHIRAEELGRPLRGAVIGGGLLGLEAAGALHELNVGTTVVEFAERLMPLQVDAGGGEALKRLIEKLGVSVVTSTATSEIHANDHGVVSRMSFSDGSQSDIDIVDRAVNE